MSGTKPAIAFANQATAVANIEHKLSVFRECLDWCLRQPLERASGSSLETVRFSLPKSIRQFNAWTGQGLPLQQTDGALLRNANQTLSAQPALLAEARFLIEQARQIKKLRNVESRRTETMAALSRRASHAEALRSISEREVVALKRANASLKSQVDALQHQLRALRRESTVAIEQLRGRLGEADTLRSKGRKRKAGFEVVK